MKILLDPKDKQFKETRIFEPKITNTDKNKNLTQECYYTQKREFKSKRKFRKISLAPKSPMVIDI